MNPNAVMVSAGDYVFAWKFVYDREYSTRGTVVERIWGEISECYCAKIRDEKTGELDWFNAENDLCHKFEVFPPNNTPFTHATAVRELLRQLGSGEATCQQYERVVEQMESDMIEMHAVGAFDVLHYMQCEATANAYREALQLEPSSIRAQAAQISSTLTNAEYQTAVAATLPQTMRQQRRNGGGQLWEPCPRCGEGPVHLDCGYCDLHCKC